MDYFFIQWVLILLFILISQLSQLWQVGVSQTGSYNLLACPCVSFGSSLFPGTTQCFWLFLSSFCLSPEIDHLSKEMGSFILEYNHFYILSHVYVHFYILSLYSPASSLSLLFIYKTRVYTNTSISSPIPQGPFFLSFFFFQLHPFQYL